MINIDPEMVAAALPARQLIDALNAAFANDVDVPSRVHHEVPVPGGNPGTLLLMPAWRSGAHIGVKVVTVFKLKYHFLASVVPTDLYAKFDR